MKFNLDFKRLKESALKIWRNKYLVATIIFLAWVLFFDENSIVSHNRNKNILKELTEQKETYREQIKSDEQKLEDLNSGPENLEKFAREQYRMKKADEDLYIIMTPREERQNNRRNN